MGTRGEALAAKVQQTSDQLVALIEGCPDAKWQKQTASEGWSVAVAAHHAASSYGPTSQLVGAIAKGGQLPPITREMLDGGNAQHAKEFAGCSKSDTAALARKEGAAAAAMMRGLSDEELARTASFPLAGPEPVSAAQLAEFLVVGHPTGHMESIRATA